MDAILLLPAPRKQCDDCGKTKRCPWQVIDGNGSKLYYCNDCYTPF